MKEVKRLKEQMEPAEQELADVEGNFQKYQAAVDAGLIVRAGDDTEIR